MPAERNIAVVGCGNIGSRHLQGLTSFGRPARIWAVEPDAAALDLSRRRVAEMSADDRLSFEFCESPSALPTHLDLVVVATSAGVRRAVATRVMDGREIGALILEKFLFQSIADLDEFGDLLARRGIPAFVNTPRRAWPIYSELRKELGDAPFTMVVDLNRTNGLATNAIHFLDLVAFLSGCGGEMTLDGRDLRPVEGVSRHAGAVDFHGTLRGVTATGCDFVLNGRIDGNAPHAIALLSRDKRILIAETLQKAWVADGASGWSPGERAFPIMRQSELTGRIAAEIFDGGTTSLPGYAESAKLHRLNLEVFLQAMGKPVPPSTVVPIT